MIALYLCFRLKHTTRLSVNALFRLHLFSFLFSIFNLVTGYLEVIKFFSTDYKSASISDNIYMVVVFLSLIGAHVVVCVYTCCSKYALNNQMTEPRRSGYTL